MVITHLLTGMILQVNCVFRVKPRNPTLLCSAHGGLNRYLIYIYIRIYIHKVVLCMCMYIYIYTIEICVFMYINSYDNQNIDM